MKSQNKVKSPLNWIDTMVTIAFLLIGLFFFSFSFYIDDSLSGSSVGPRLVPQVIALLLIVIAVGVLINSALVSFSLQNKTKKNQPSADLMDSSATESEQVKKVEMSNYEIEHSESQPSWAQRFLPLQILVISMLYVFMFHWFGYLLATAICAIPIYASFGNRNVMSLLVVPAITIALFYSLFFGVMGLYDLPGSFIDITEWFR